MVEEKRGHDCVSRCAADVVVLFLPAHISDIFITYFIIHVTMRKVYFWLIFGLILVGFSSCSRYYLVDSEGILEWDGTMRKLNMIWNHKQAQPVYIHDTLYVKPIVMSDSIR